MSKIELDEGEHLTHANGFSIVRHAQADQEGERTFYGLISFQPETWANEEKFQVALRLELLGMVEDVKRAIWAERVG